MQERLLKADQEHKKEVLEIQANNEKVINALKLEHGS